MKVDSNHLPRLLARYRFTSRLCLVLILAALALPYRSEALEPADTGFSWPIGCIPGMTCAGRHFRIGYPDIAGVGKSYSCGQPGYTGHQGTDILVSAVEQKVPVMAAADGEVRWLKDGLFDHCPDFSQPDCGEEHKTILTSAEGKEQASLGFNAGNFIVIAHTLENTRYLTLYAHLATGSLQVVPGQHIKRGQVIAQVGSSGNSQIPHLHFGVYREEGKYYQPVDPWSGPCNTSSAGLWIVDPPYEISGDDPDQRSSHAQTSKTSYTR